MGSQVSSAGADALRVMNSIRRIVRALRASSTEAERAVGVSGAQLFVLTELADREAQSLHELAARTTTDPSSVSVVVQKLVDRGLVVRKRAPDDARRAELALSARGRKLLARAPRTAQRLLVDTALGLPPARRRSLADGLELLVRGIGAHDDTPTLFFEEPSRATKTATKGASRAKK